MIQTRIHTHTQLLKLWFSITAMSLIETIEPRTFIFGNSGGRNKKKY